MCAGPAQSATSWSTSNLIGLLGGGGSEGWGKAAFLSAKLIGSRSAVCRSDDNTHTWNKIYNYNHGYIMAKI